MKRIRVEFENTAVGTLALGSRPLKQQLGLESNKRTIIKSKEVIMKVVNIIHNKDSDSFYTSADRFLEYSKLMLLPIVGILARVTVATVRENNIPFGYN
jgi:hypothetical protein